MSIVSAPLFQRLLARSPFSEHELIVLIATAASRYKVHFIDKRGGRGRREIAQPTKEIKFLQRLLISEELQRLPVHDAAVAYRTGQSILDHAQPHAAARYLLKLDFTNFFPSLTWGALEHRLSRDVSYSKVELWILSNLLCRRAKRTNTFQLSIGAPSSPHISNYVLHEFDSRMTEFCATRKVRYTRYADDLAFSTRAKVSRSSAAGLARHVERELVTEGLSANRQKTTIVPPGARKILLGVLVDRRVPHLTREFRNNIETHLYAIETPEIGVIRHSTARNFASILGMKLHIQGLIAFAKQVDPQYGDRLYSRFNRVRWDS